MPKSTLLKKSWILLYALSVIGFLVWFKFSYPQLAFIDVSVDRREAISIAEKYLNTHYPEYKQYYYAATFGTESRADRYMQKSLGFLEMKNFIDKHDFDIFYWRVRFFKEQEREEFNFSISAKTGQIISFGHAIDQLAFRPAVKKEDAKQQAIDYLSENFGFNLSEYTQKSDLTHKRDNREEYSFSWKKNSVSIPWSNQEKTGRAKLAATAKITGHELLSFSKNYFIIPDDFIRELRRKSNIGRNIGIVIKIIFYILIFTAVYYIIVRRNHLAMHSSKKFYYTVAGIIFLLTVINIFNRYEYLLISLPTTTPFQSFLIRHILNSIISLIFVSMIFLIPGLAGELLHFEQKKFNKKEGSFLYYIQTTFFSRPIAHSIFLGYLTCLMMLGLQSFLVEMGQRHLGVWTEFSWINKIPSTYIPLLATITLAFQSSLMEEIVYRLFAINIGKKFFKNTFLAVLFASLVWGFAHSSYPVYPMWFRGLEVTCLGLLLSWIYLQHGIITVIVAHFLFNAFWNTAGFIFGSSHTQYALTSIIVLLMPLVYGLVAFIINKKEELKELKWQLNKHQLFNVEVLASYLKKHQDEFSGFTDEEIVKKITGHGWDIAVVECALKDFRSSK